MKRENIRVALVGLGFGAEFVPIYLHHPDVEFLAICDSNERVLAEVGDRYQVQRRLHSLEEAVTSDEYDAVHLVTPIPLHARQAITVLESGKHCACTVPMATTLDDLFAIVAAQRRSGKNYMMMETAVYTREFLFVKDMLARGEFGTLQLLRGAHYQDMEHWPWYWMGLPPMHYATHAIAPLLALAETRAVKVHCFGSGRMRAELHVQYGNAYPVEAAIFRLERAELAAEVTRSLFHTARAYTESFNVYAENATFEWAQLETEGEGPVLFKSGPLASGRGKPISSARIDVPDRQDLLPEPIRRFTRRGVYDETNPHLSFLQGGGHGGSHPHLVHEFVSSIVEQRRPWIDAVTAANWTAAGICAHLSAMQDGDGVHVPGFDTTSAL
jgi:predicted dehydrogenase